MKDNMFTILIGSVARNDFNRNSDVDICRINNQSLIDRQVDWPIGPINYIDYTWTDFVELWEQGSLFIYHVLFEGLLLQGNVTVWENFKQSFMVKRDFSEELNKIFGETSIFGDLGIFGDQFLALYSNLFVSVKNFSIFYFANQGEYKFNKADAVKCLFGENYFDLLMDSYNHFEKGIASSLWDYNSEELSFGVVGYYRNQMKEKLL